MTSNISINPAVYPVPRKDATIVDDFHGTKVADPYRYLEDPDGEETKAFVDKLNEISKPFLDNAESRQVMHEKLSEMWNYEKFGCTTKRGSFYYYQHNSGLQNQYVLYQQKSLNEKGSVFLDVNEINKEGTTSLRTSAWTKDGSIYAYGLSENGSDWVTVKFKKADGTDLDDVITGVKHSGLSWTGDKSGVFYCKYPEHDDKIEGTSTLKHEFHSLFYHKLGTDCKEDVLVYERRDDPNFMIDGSVTDDGKFLIIGVSRGCDPYNMVYYYDLQAVENKITEKINPVPLFDQFDARYDYVDHDDNTILFQTNKDAPMFKLVRVDLQNLKNVTEVVAEKKEHTLSWATPLPGNRLMLSYLEDVKSTLYVHDLNTGEKLYQIPLPIGSISGFYSKKEENEVFYQFESFVVPGITYHMNFENVDKNEIPKIEVLRKVGFPGLDESKFKVEQVFYESKDKTKVPMYIVSTKDMVKNGENPVILNGYGGFNIADSPYFSVSRLLFIQHFGGIIACANLRGGSEYGETWHFAGMRENKQNVFDDMQHAAMFLIDKKYTNSSKLAIHGGSNGGLLMGACSQQRPDLFGAVINRVGVLDMLRFHKFTIGGAWVPEFGNPDEAKDFEFIYKYSPLHNINFPDGGQWPSTLLMTADHDDRVVPSHTLKYAATLLEKAKQHPEQTNPLLARIEVKAGHGSGKPTAKVIEECVDMYCFLERVLGLKWQQ
ncbi:unnamed protein product [Auanema sp. JU1783]|nr:unnamed protein product [Auanema sp. JU1783]